MPLFEENRKAGKLKRGGDRRSKVAEKPLKLSDEGIDKNLADRARKAAALSEAKFEQQVARAVKVAVAATEGDAAVVKEARKSQQDMKRRRRAERERLLAGKIVALPDKRYGVIVADPEWKDTVWSEETGMDRHAGNHYPTSDAAVIASRNVASISAKDCVLWIWTTNQHLRIALGVMEAWGFEYKSNYCWGKDKFSTGRWNRSKHELLLIGTQGKVPCPAPGTQWESLVRLQLPRRDHSDRRKLVYTRSWGPKLRPSPKAGSLAGLFGFILCHTLHEVEERLDTVLQSPSTPIPKSLTLSPSNRL
jgi:N6-adenosine-specific RNA methylase IME4